MFLIKNTISGITLDDILICEKEKIEEVLKKNRFDIFGDEFDIIGEDIEIEIEKSTFPNFRVINTVNGNLEREEKELRIVRPFIRS